MSNVIFLSATSENGRQEGRHTKRRLMRGKTLTKNDAFLANIKVAKSCLLHFCRQIFGSHLCISSRLSELIYDRRQGPTLKDFPNKFLNKWG